MTALVVINNTDIKNIIKINEEVLKVMEVVYMLK